MYFRIFSNPSSPSWVYRSYPLPPGITSTSKSLSFPACTSAALMNVHATSGDDFSSSAQWITPPPLQPTSR